MFWIKQNLPRSGHRPSVDVMFEDVSHYNDFDKIAVIMTGMGYDGSKGLTALKETGNVMAIAESARYLYCIWNAESCRGNAASR